MLALRGGKQLYKIVLQGCSTLILSYNLFKLQYIRA